MRVLVTGANGFVGRALVRDLHARGYSVRAAVRRPGHAVPGAAEHWVGDLTETEDLGAAVRGTDAVAHLAARVHILGDRSASEHRRVNVEATSRLAAAAATAGVGRFVFLSSVKASGEGKPDAPYTEDDPPEPADPYGASKWEAERALRSPELAGLKAVVLRPPLVYGPGAAANFRALLGLCDGPLPVPLGAARANARSMIYLGNLADAICLALQHPEAAGRTYFVRDGEDLSPAMLVARLRRALGRPARLVPVPRAAFALAERAARRPGAADRLFGSLRVDDSRIRRELGWRPPFTVDQGLAATAAWLRIQRSGRFP